MHCAISFILSEAKAQGLTDKVMNSRAGYSHAQMNRFRYALTEKADIYTVENYLNVLGYKLAVVPNEQTE